MGMIHDEDSFFSSVEQSQGKHQNKNSMAKTMVFVNECAADGCYKKNLGNGKQMCKEHQKMYETGVPFKAFYGKKVLKKEFQK